MSYWQLTTALNAHNARTQCISMRSEKLATVIRSIVCRWCRLFNDNNQISGEFPFSHRDLITPKHNGVSLIAIAILMAWITIISGIHYDKIQWHGSKRFILTTIIKSMELQSKYNFNITILYSNYLIQLTGSYSKCVIHKNINIILAAPIPAISNFVEPTISPLIYLHL